MQSEFRGLMEFDGIMVEVRGVVQNHWYVVRHEEDGRVVSVGHWLPPQCNGLIIEKVDDADAKTALEFFLNKITR